MTAAKTVADVQRRVSALLEEELGVTGPLALSDRFEQDLGCDSLDRFEISLGCEQAFGVEIPDADAEQLETVGDLVGYLATRLTRRSDGHIGSVGGE